MLLVELFSFYIYYLLIKKTQMYVLTAKIYSSIINCLYYNSFATEMYLKSTCTLSLSKKRFFTKKISQIEFQFIFNQKKEEILIEMTVKTILKYLVNGLSDQTVQLGTHQSAAAPKCKRETTIC